MNKEIKIYGCVGMYGNTASEIIAKIDEAVNSGATSLTFRMHSEGGCVIDGSAIFNAIKKITIPTKVVIEGIAASMASIIILAADEVEICENAFIMVHRPTSTDSGDYDSLTQSVKILKDIESNFLKCYSQKTGLSANEIKTNWLDGKDHWINADEAVKLGLADRKVLSIAKGVSIGAKKKDIKSIYAKFASKLNISNNNNIKMKEEIIKRFNLKDVDAESTDIEVLDKLEEYIKSLQEEKEKGEEKAVETVVESAIHSGKILASAKKIYMNIGKTSGISILNAVFEAIPTFRPLASYIKPEAKYTLENIQSSNDKYVSDNHRHNMTNWGLDEYRKYAPQALKDNPRLYEELYEKEHGKNK